MTLILYHLAESVVEHHLLGTWLRLGSVCACVCVPCRISCIPTLSVDPESRRLLHVAGGTLKVEVETSQELQRRLKSERQIDGIQGDSDIGALPKSAPHNLVSERRFTDGRQVSGTQDKEVSNSAAVSKGGHRIYRKVGQPASHDVLCEVNDEFCMIDSSDNVS